MNVPSHPLRTELPSRRVPTASPATLAVTSETLAALRNLFYTCSSAAFFVLGLVDGPFFFIFIFFPSWPSGQPKKIKGLVPAASWLRFGRVGAPPRLRNTLSSGRRSSVISHPQAHRRSINSLSHFLFFISIHFPRSTTTANSFHRASRSAHIWRPGEELYPPPPPPPPPPFPPTRHTTPLFQQGGCHTRRNGARHWVHRRISSQARGVSCRNCQLNRSAGVLWCPSFIRGRRAKGTPESRRRCVKGGHHTRTSRTLCMTALPG